MMLNSHLNKKTRHLPTYPTVPDASFHSFHLYHEVKWLFH